MTTDADRLEELRALLASPGWQYVANEILEKTIQGAKALRSRLDEYELGRAHGQLTALEWAHGIADAEINLINAERKRKTTREAEDGPED